MKTISTPYSLKMPARMCKGIAHSRILNYLNLHRSTILLRLKMRKLRHLKRQKC